MNIMLHFSLVSAICHLTEDVQWRTSRRIPEHPPVSSSPHLSFFQIKKAVPRHRKQSNHEMQKCCPVIKDDIPITAWASAECQYVDKSSNDLWGNIKQRCRMTNLTNCDKSAFVTGMIASNTMTLMELSGVGCGGVGQFFSSPLTSS